VANNQVKILFIWLYVFFSLCNDGNSFSLMFELCGNMNFLEVNARL